MAAMSAKPELPTFSYAQAAKGISATPQPRKSASSDSDKESPMPDEQNTNSSPQTKSETVIMENGVARGAENPAASADKESEPIPAAKPKANGSGMSSPSVGASSTSAAGKDDESTTPNGTSDSTWDKQSQTSGTEKPKNNAEGAKAKSNSTAENASLPPKELKAAPLPSVNIWQQRREAQDAKAKTMGSVKSDAPSTAHPGAAKTSSPSSSASVENQQEFTKSTSKKKGTDGVSEGAKDRKKTDGRKGRVDDMSLPPVGDASSWPTPQVAQGEEMRKAQEKTDKSEKGEKNPAIRPHGKEKWMPVPYVPTAVFNTPLPSAGRRGGRAARSGKDGGRGAGDQASQALGDKQSASADRGRNETNVARANSLPAQSRRANSADAAKTGDARKNSQPADRSRGAKGAEDAAAGKENFPRPPRDGKALPRNEFGPHKGADNSRNPRLNLDSQSGSRTGSSNDRRFENGPKSADIAGFHGDRDHKENNFREPRGRGPRGRGHAGYPGSQNQFVNHMPPFSHPKSFGFNDRQRSHGLPNGSHQGHKMPIRSPSLPNSASMYGVYPFPADINAMYGYPAMQAGPMSAVPYQQYMEPFSLMSMISMQLEYYFSVDNLCKDLFLRKHMDSQGFVALGFIAGFKRIKTLTEDFELLRHVCRQLRNVEYQAGEDGVDRLRAKERWQQWVLPMEQRDPSGQHEGPPPLRTSEENITPQGHMDGTPNGSAQGAPPKPLPNGAGEHRGTATSLSLAAPEFSPSDPMAAHSEDTTVWLPHGGYRPNWRSAGDCGA